MPYEIVQNSTRSNVWIKKSTFLLYSVRVLVSFFVKWVFQMLWLFDSLIKRALFIFTHFGFEIHDFSAFLIFFCLCLHAWIEVGQNTVWTIPIRLRPFGLKCISICYINYSRKVPKEFISQKFWSKKSFISTHYRYKKKLKTKTLG